MDVSSVRGMAFKNGPTQESLAVQEDSAVLSNSSFRATTACPLQTLRSAVGEGFGETSASVFSVNLRMPL